MKKLKQYTIQFIGLKLGKHQFKYQINNEFFDFFEYDDFNSVDVSVTLNFEKKTTMLELDFEIEGTMNVNCDVTNEPYDQPVQNKLSLVVKFGDTYNNENEELLIIPHGEYQLEVQQYIYEAIVLALPYKRVHPGVKDGTMESEVLDKLEELKPNANPKPDTEEIDPRWNKLKELLNDK